MLNFFKKFKKEVLPPSGHLCECRGDIEISKGIECEHFPLQKGFHTSFLIFKCIKCNGFHGFPHYNLELAIKEASEEGKSILTKLGVKV